MDTAHAELGGFELLVPIAEGGMGAVWRARHRRTGTPAAVKVVRGPRLKPRLAAAVRTEARAAAALNHPSITWLYDFGEVAASEARKGLPAGAPWLAMELVDGGTLEDRADAMTWPALRRVLRQLLAALAHAHARGVIHRDLKPGNVLFGSTRRQSRARLSDFGMAILLDEGRRDARDLQGGTPGYMAPEQWEAEWAEQGPWTDLYALACLGWHVACGERPFPGRGWRELAIAHMRGLLEPFRPRMPVPAGLEAWLLRCLQREPAGRFRCAADAAAALRALDGTPEPAGFPPRWIATRGAPVGRKRPEAGLALYGVRGIPEVGRSRERRALWQALGSVVRGRGAAVQILRGPAGVGKSHLARWLARAAHEAGVADPLVVRHGPLDRPDSGLSGLVDDALRCAGAPREQVLARAEAELRALGCADPTEWRALVELARPETDEVPAVRPPTVSERHEAVAAYLARRAEQRPLVVWIDDGQWGPDALRFAAGVLERRAGLPVLFVVTVQEEALAERPAAAKALRQLTELPCAAGIEIRPLRRDRHAALVRRLLPLEPGLQARVVARTRGNPLFAVQLLGDWVERGVLVGGPDGLSVAPDTSVSLPRSLGEVWLARVDEVLSRDPSWEVPLGLAAALGVDVRVEEWKRACRAHGLTVPHPLVRALLRRRLAAAEQPWLAWSFRNAILCESVLERFGPSRRRALHSACAEALETLGPGHAGREGRHRLAAGQAGRAAGPLTTGARAAYISGRYLQARALLDAAREALSASGALVSDRRWGELRWIGAKLDEAEGRFDAASAGAARLLEEARRRSWAELEARALVLQTALALDQGRPGRAQATATAALRLARAHDLEETAAQGRFQLGVIARTRGELDRARALLDAAVRRFEEAGARYQASFAWIQLAFTEQAQGDLDAAGRAVERAQAHARAVGSRWALAHCVLERGEILRQQGDLERAERCIRDAWARYAALGHHQEGLARVNLGLVLIDRERWPEARAHFEACLAEGSRRGDPHYAFGARAGLLACVAGGEDESAWRVNLAWVVNQPYVEADLASLASLAARRAAAAAYPARARAAAALAVRLWERLGREGDAARERAWMGGLGLRDAP